MFGLSPWLLGGGAILLVVTNLATGWKAYEFGGNAAKVECEQRVNRLQKLWEIEVAKNKATNDAWTEAITKVLESGNKEAVDLQTEITELNKKVEDYEASVGTDPACTLNKSDADRLR